MTLITLLVIAAALFGLAFLTKRRYGVLGLGLASGLVLSQEISKEVAASLQSLDVPVEPLPFTAAASILLILAPALVMLFSGPKYTDQRYAVAGSILFAVFGVVLLLAPLVTSLPFDDRAALQPLISQVALNSPLIISAAVVLAVFDMMHAQGKSPLSKKSKH
jgi:hypothetical protein